jgi:hypothetical protein
LILEQQQKLQQQQQRHPQHHHRVLEQKRFAGSPQQLPYGSPLSSQPVFPTNVPA